MASSPSQTYKVFISHAGEDKTTIAIPLREKLVQRGIRAFVDERDIAAGTRAEDSMIAAMEEVDIAVVVLSPEFVARKWTMKELLCFLGRSELPLTDRRRLPIIIPLFYRLSIKDLYDEPRLDRLDSQGKSLYHSSRFFERMDNSEPEANIGNIKVALRKVRGFMGTENYVDATNDSTAKMGKRRDVLMNDLCDKVQEAISREADEHLPDFCDSQTTVEKFRRHCYEDDDVSDLILDFEDIEGNKEPRTVEADVLHALLDRSNSTDIISIQGIGGVGKTSVLRGLSRQKLVTERFKDGTHLISLGADATHDGILEALYQMVEESGGRTRANEIRKEKKWLKVYYAFRSWFEGKECLFMIDDVWETSKISSGVILELLKIHHFGSGSKILLTTRSTEIACRAKKFFALRPRDPLAFQCRRILLLHSGVEIDDWNGKDGKAVLDILRKCSGLPFFLKVAGRAVKHLSHKPDVLGYAAYHLYARTLDHSVQSWLNTDVDSYERLERTLSVSIQLLEDRKGRWGFPVRLTAAEMHRRLSIIGKQSHLPMTMLRHLWELQSESQAVIVAREFEQIAVATIDVQKEKSRYVERLRLHDSLHEFAIGETTKYREEGLGHKKVIEGYGRGLDERNAGCREWWSTQLEQDGYIHSHLSHHLQLGGFERELMGLLLMPEWTIRLLEISGIAGVERSYSDGISCLNDVEHQPGSSFSSQKEVIVSRQKAIAMKMVLDATRLLDGFSHSSPREVCFQLYGRLNVFIDENNAILEYLQRLENYAQEQCLPWLRCTNSVLVFPGEAATRIFYVGSPVVGILFTNDGNLVYAYTTDDGNMEIGNCNWESGKTEKEHRTGQQELFTTVSFGFSPTNVAGFSLRDSDAEEARECEIERVWASKIPANDLKCIESDDSGLLWATGSEDGKVQIWDAEREQFVKGALRTHSGAVNCIAFLPGSEHVIYGIGKELRIWKVTGGEETTDTVLTSDSDFERIAKTPDGRFLVSGHADHTVKTWDIERKMQTGLVCKGHAEDVTSVAICRNGRTAASGYADGTICVWDISSGRQICSTLRGHTGSITEVLFDPSDKGIISCSKDGTIRGWDLNTARARRNGLDRHKKMVKSVTFTSDGMRVISGSSDHSVRIWDVKSGRQVGEPLLGHTDVVKGVVVTPHSKVVSVSKDATVLVWDLESHELVHTLTDHSESIDSIALTRNGDHVITSSLDQTVREWDITAGREVRVVAFLGPDVFFPILIPISTGLKTYFDISKIFVTDDGRRLITALASRNVVVFDLKEGFRIKVVSVPEKRPVTMSRSEIMALVGETTIQTDAQISIVLGEHQIWFGDNEERVLLGTMEASIACWALSPDKKTICAGLADGRVAFMELVT